MLKTWDRYAAGVFSFQRNYSKSFLSILPFVSAAGCLNDPRDGGEEGWLQSFPLAKTGEGEIALDS
ncbi:MAG: hypothetical protein PWP57_549 [Candidatus Atribacteria bacterium]|nr:hypothetical protein [Candidatus Atribacteria bacterium]